MASTVSFDEERVPCLPETYSVTGIEIEESLIREMDDDDVRVARFTRAIVRCALGRDGTEFRKACRGEALAGFYDIVTDPRHPQLRLIWSQEASLDLAIVRLAVRGMISSYPESWFATSDEAGTIAQRLIDRTYVW